MSVEVKIEAGAPLRAQRGLEKTSKNRIKVQALEGRMPRKPAWIKVRAPSGARVRQVKTVLRSKQLKTVCEEASCPNLGECFAQGTATFMIMGELCTRRCPFCDVAHGRPDPLDPAEPAHLAEAVKDLKLRYVVITSVDRDDLRDGGAAHFAACIRELRRQAPTTRIEILVPDFRGRMDKALEILAADPPDVFNHNLETIPRLYRQARPGADYAWSLQLLKDFAARCPQVPTKSGLMVGIGEEYAEVVEVLKDLRAHGCNRLTIGQYLAPSRHHLPVERYWHPTEFDQLGATATALGFTNVASGPLVRSSYYADRQAAGEIVS